MAKKSKKSPNSQNIANHTTTSENMAWIVTNLLETRDINHYEMKIEKLEEVKLLFRAPVNAIVSVRADHFKQDWVCFYYYPFDIGLTFPFSPFIADVLKSLNVSPAQLIPFAWRTLACLDAIEGKHHLNINIYVVKHSYSLKKFSGCQIGFVNRNTDDPLILKNETVNDRNWKKLYFFINKKSLDGTGDYLLDHWNQSGNY